MKFKHSLTVGVAGAVGLAFSAGAIAQSNTPQDKRFYVAPMVSYGFFDHDSTGGSNFNGTGVSPGLPRLRIDNENSIGGTLAVGKPINSWLNLELFGFYFNPDQKLNGVKTKHADLWSVGLDALFFPARDTLPLYGILGASYGQIDPGYSSVNGIDVGDDADVDNLDAGLGVLVPINDYGVAVRAEYRYRYTTIDSEDVFGPGFEDQRQNNHILSLGLQIPLGAPPQAAAPAPAPAPAEPLDSDGDGVIDANDQCPGTPRGTEVDARGCPIEKQAPIVLKGVTFEFDMSRLTSQATSRLDNVVDALKANDEVDFRIDGYTDSIGTEKYNKALSQRRMDSVRKYLTQHGISTSRITGTTGHGESDPVASNKTKAGRAQNRRVELHVTGQ